MRAEALSYSAVKLFYCRSIRPTCVQKNIPERHRQTDGRTDDLL